MSDRRPKRSLRTAVRGLPLLASVLAAAFVAAAAAQPPSTASSTDRPPSPFAVLAQVKTAYDALPAYADQGILRLTAPGKPAVELTFATRAVRSRGFRFEVGKVDASGRPWPWKVLWRQGEEGRCWDAGLNQVKTVSLLSELANGFVDGGQDALAVPALLLGDDPLEGPDGAALDGPEPCGDGGECWLIHLARMNGAVTSRLWADLETGLLHRIEVELYGALPGPAGVAGRAPVLLEVELRPEIPAAPPEAGEVAWSPPPSARPVADWEGEPERLATGELQPEAVFGEVISVELLTVKVRVLDAREQPVPDLAPEDFRVLAGHGATKREVAVAAVDWVSSVPSPEPVERLSGETPWGEALFEPEVRRGAPTAGKKVLVFVQADFNGLRIRGHMKLVPRLDAFLSTLQPEDEVALVSFDSHLKLWQDFTRDREKVRRAVGQAIRFSAPPPPLRSSERGLLAEHFDFREAKRAALPERALELAARALIPVPGDKAVVYLGWGLGRFGRGGVRMRPEYYPAVQALREAGAPVFVLDISEADYHSLEIGLENVAAATGGTYAKTFRFPEQALRGLSGALAGYYVLTFSAADLPEGIGALRIALRELDGVVHVQP